MSNFSKRATVTPTRAGMITTEFWICWDCYNEIYNEADLAGHKCESEGFIYCASCNGQIEAEQANPFNRECETCENSL